MKHRIVLGETVKEFLLSKDSLPPELLVRDRRYTLIEPVKAGHKGAIWRAKDEYARDRAIKFAIWEDYEDRSYLSEIAHAAKLEKFEEFARIDGAGIVELSIAAESVKFVCFVEEWIQGQSLADFVVQRPEEVTVSFLLAYVSFLSRVLQALSQESLQHDDLHAGNVMIAAPIGEGVLSEQRFKVVDLGSLKPSTAITKKDRDDLQNFVMHLVQLWNVISNRSALPGHDKRFLYEAEKLLALMLDTEPSIALRDPAQIATRFKEAQARCALPISSNAGNLNAPFEFLSAEQIADDRVLVGIFAKSCPWLSKVSGRDPCLVTGPRGCGKSTIFRWLSLKAHLHLGEPDLDALLVSGFYISCSTDMQNRLGWIRTRSLAERFEPAIIHFFNMMLAREILYTLELIYRRADRETRWGFGEAQEDAIYRFLDSTVGHDAIRLQGLPRISQLREHVEIEIMATHTDWLAGKVRTRATSRSFLGDFTSFLVKIMPYFEDRPIAFLVDDFSVHRLPEPVQIILNRIIWERRASHIFKLSAEKYGAILSDNFEATAELSRELIEVDCGKEFIALDDHVHAEKSLTFAQELLDNRLARAGYRGTSEQIIGRSHWKEGSLAKALVAKKTGGRGGQYHGLDCISQLCSGDVSTLLLVYQRIFELGGVDKDSTTTVKSSVQDRAVRDTSRRLVEGIRTYFPCGPEMHTIAIAFGTLVRKFLTEGKWQRAGKLSVPTQCPRIEIDQDKGAVVDTLNADQRKLATEIVRRSIFLEMDVGLSRHQAVTTLRWHFRRIFLPNFGAAVAKNDAVKKKTDWFKFFLTEPEVACDQVWRAAPRKVNRRKTDRDDDGQDSLF
jgi:serine/threonine protein kinase